jgi:hypothetical protein
MAAGSNLAVDDLLGTRPGLNLFGLQTVVEQGIGPVSPGSMEFSKPIKTPLRSLVLRDCLNFLDMDRFVGHVKGSGHHNSLPLILFGGCLIIKDIGTVAATIGGFL